MNTVIKNILNSGATHYAVGSLSPYMVDSACFYKKIDGIWLFKTVHSSPSSDWVTSSITPENARALVPIDATHRRPVAIKDGQIGYDFYRKDKEFYRYNKMSNAWNIVSYITQDTIDQMEEINKPAVISFEPNMAQKMRALAEETSYKDLLRDIDAEARKGNVQLKISATGALIDRERLKKDGFIVTSVTGNFVIHW